jgi:hypothetical protein
MIQMGRAGKREWSRIEGKREWIVQEGSAPRRRLRRTARHSPAPTFVPPAPGLPGPLQPDHRAAWRTWYGRGWRRDWWEIPQPVRRASPRQFPAPMDAQSGHRILGLGQRPAGPNPARPYEPGALRPPPTPMPWPTPPADERCGPIPLPPQAEYGAEQEFLPVAGSSQAGWNTAHPLPREPLSVHAGPGISCCRACRPVLAVRGFGDTERGGGVAKLLKIRLSHDAWYETEVHLQPAAAACLQPTATPIQEPRCPPHHCRPADHQAPGDSLPSTFRAQRSTTHSPPRSAAKRRGGINCLGRKAT